VTVRYLGYKAERRRRYNSQPAPVFTQDFTTGGGGALPPGSTFSRGTIGTLYNSQGLVAYAPSNLLLQSQALNLSPWVTQPNVTLTSTNTGVAPDGTLTASLWTFSGTSNNSIYQSYNTAVNQTLTGSVYLKGQAGQTISVSWQPFSGSAVFTVWTLTGNWDRVSATATNGATAGSGNFAISVTAGQTATAVYVWGAQLEASPTATTYTPTTTAAVYGPRFDYDPTNVLQQNFLLNSGNLSAGTWNTNNLVVANNVLQAPDGTYTGASITAPVTGFAYLSTNPPVAYNSATTLTYSVFVKANTISQLYIGLYDTSFVGTSASAVVLSGPGSLVNVTGSLYSLTGLSTTQWTQVAVTRTGFAAAVQLYIYPNNNASTPAGGSIGIWQPNVNQGFTALPYLPTTSTPQTVCAPIGLLIEETRTNSALYSQDLTNATGWSASLNVTIANASTTAPDGTGTASYVLANTTNGQHWIENAYICAAGTTYTLSCYAKALGSTSATTLGLGFAYNSQGGNFNLLTGAITSTSIGATTSIKNVGNGWYRCAVTYTPTSLGAILVQPGGLLSSFAGDNASGIYVWGMQIEIGVFGTSYIPTTSAAVGRAADVLSQPISSIPYFSATAGTFAITYSLDEGANSGSPAAFTIGPSGTSSGFNTSGGGAAQWWNGSTNIITTNGSTNWALPRKEAFAYTASSRAICQNAGTVATDANVPWGTLGTTFDWGSGYGISQWINGHIRSFSYFNYALTNTQLQQVTT